MRKTRAPSKATRLTLLAMLDAPHGMYGYEIMQRAGIKPGTLYPMLARLEDQKLLTSHWQEAVSEGRPPRHVYALSETGQVFAKSLTERSLLDVTSQAKPRSA